MASVTGLLLMYLREEEEAFWALIALTNTKYQMHGKITSKHSTMLNCICNTKNRRRIYASIVQ